MQCPTDKKISERPFTSNHRLEFANAIPEPAYNIRMLLFVFPGMYVVRSANGGGDLTNLTQAVVIEL